MVENEWAEGNEWIQGGEGGWTSESMKVGCRHVCGELNLV